MAGGSRGSRSDPIVFIRSRTNVRDTRATIVVGEAQLICACWPQKSLMPLAVLFAGSFIFGGTGIGFGA
jgi:hypothetical protein